MHMMSAPVTPTSLIVGIHMSGAYFGDELGGVPPPFFGKSDPT